MNLSQATKLDSGRFLTVFQKFWMFIPAIFIWELPPSHELEQRLFFLFTSLSTLTCSNSVSIISEVSGR